MKTIIEIIALCGVFVGGMGWLMNRPARPKDPDGVSFGMEKKA